MSGWTAQRVQELAPDAASAKAGQGLANARHWASAALDGDALWGECQGSGAKPYQVRVDLAEPAFKCSCPSRKFPCKHAIGLMLMHAAGTVTTGAKPSWVEEWLASRATREAKKQERADALPKPVDEAAQARRLAQRDERIADGLAALERWLHDLAKNGIAIAPSQPFAFFDDAARRLVDAQATGVARRVQSLAGIAASGEGWQRRFLEQLALIELLIRGYARRDALPLSPRDVMMNAIGVPRATEDILALPPLADHWHIVAQQVTEEDRLRVMRTWLFGRTTRRAALVLTFAHGNQPFDASLPPGFEFDGELCFYPGDPTRALVKTNSPLTPIAGFDGLDRIDAMIDAYATCRATNPWTDGLAVPLCAVTPRLDGGRLTIADLDGARLALTAGEADRWSLLALSGGAPLDSLVIHFDGRTARPLAATIGTDHQRLGMRRETEVA